MIFIIVVTLSTYVAVGATSSTPLTSSLSPQSKSSRTTEYEQRTCSFVKGLHANLIRFITQEGFHRDLEDTVEVTVTTSAIPLKYFSSGECLLGVYHELSKDVYVDPYEILRNSLLNEYIRVLTNWTDLENPAWLAKSNSSVFIQFKPILTGNLISTESVQLPIHYRYQIPRSHSRMKSRGIRSSAAETGSGMLNPAGYTPVTLPLPELILRCNYWDSVIVEEQCKTISVICDRKSSSKCPWILIPYKSNLKSGTVYIPIGDSDSTFLITSVTTIVSLGGMLFLMLTLVRTKQRLDIEILNSNSANPQFSTHPHED